MPASKMTAANGKPRQTFTAMIEMIARVGSPSQFGLNPGRSRPAACPSQLMMLYCVSNIHFQVIELSATGIVQGSRITKRNQRVPGRFSASRKASEVPSSPLNTAETAVKSSVFRKAV